MKYNYLYKNMCGSCQARCVWCGVCRAADVVLYSNHAKQQITCFLRFKILPPKDWSWDAWKGFYTVLQESLDNGNWECVPHPSEG